MGLLLERAYNPDVLSCLANLSNDEVFTPPEVANQMLDLLPPEIWKDRNIKILDPACKTGVFLREAAKRFIDAQIPNYQEIARGVNEKRQKGEELSEADKDFLSNLEAVTEHVFKNQLFGIAITEMTSLLSRRGVYCSKYPNSKYSVVKFDNPEGNIRYRDIKHTWGSNKKCIYCGAPKDLFDRDEGLESHAYELIHMVNPEEIFDMKFDVIVGNPPYQLNDGGYRISASPIYHKFVQQAKKLNPRYLSMIIPSRWFSGGKGLDEFRREMLNDNRLRVIHDFPDASDVFPGVQIKGGICYFLWERDNQGDCAVTTHNGHDVGETVVRPLLEEGLETFIRWNEAVGILHKVQAFNEDSFVPLVSSRKPFGFDTLYHGKQSGDVVLYENGGKSFVSREEITKNLDAVDKWKVFIPRAGSGSDAFPHSILGTPFVGEPNSACTETYMYIGTFESREECENVIQYIQSRVFRFLVLLHKASQDATSKVYTFVPIQDFSKAWTDEELCEKYSITEDEYDFICSLVRPAGD